MPCPAASARATSPSTAARIWRSVSRLRPLPDDIGPDRLQASEALGAGDLLSHDLGGRGSAPSRSMTSASTPRRSGRSSGGAVIAVVMGDDVHRVALSASAGPDIEAFTAEVLVDQHGPGLDRGALGRVRRRRVAELDVALPRRTPAGRGSPRCPAAVDEPSDQAAIGRCSVTT